MGKRKREANGEEAAVLLRPDQLAPRYQVSKRTISRWTEKGIVTVIRLSPKCVRFDPVACDKNCAPLHRSGNRGMKTTKALAQSFFMNEAESSHKQQPEHNWNTFGGCFIGLFPFVPHDQAPPRCSWEVGGTLKEAAANYRQAEAPFVSQIEDVIRALCKTGSASTPSKEIQYLLGLRSAVLESFFLKFAISLGNGRHSTIIPFPALPTLRVVEWFCIDWWRQHGASAVAELSYIERFLGD
jgi:hypothetical protein